MKQAIITLVAVALLAGCAALQRQDPTARLTVQYATLKYIAEDASKAARVAEIAQDARDSLDAGSVTLSLLDAALRERIDWSRLDTADRLLLDSLLVMLRDELEHRFGDGLLDGDARVQIRVVADWIIQAAAMVR